MQVYTFGRNGFTQIESERISAKLATGTDILWVDMGKPTPDDVKVLRDVFKFHPLAIEDTCNQFQRPKAEEYDHHMFIILNPIECRDKEVEFRELDIFVARNYIVTVHHDPEPVIKKAQDRIAAIGTEMPFTPTYALYTLLDIVVDGYFPLLDTVGEQIEELEDQILEDANPDTMKELFRLKRTLLNMWRIVWPQREIFNILNHHRLPYLDQQALQYYLRDVTDHLLWIADMVNTLRDTLTSLMDLYMSSVSNRLNLVVNRLTMITIIIGVFTVISGFYGMNFEQTFPPFNSPLGVPFVLLLMAFVGVSVPIVFRRLRLVRDKL